MQKEQRTECEELFDDQGEPICDGQMVRVNGDYVRKVHVDGGGLFHIDGWPRHILIQSLEVVES